MTLRKKIVVGLTATLATLAVAVLSWVAYMASPTSGTPIGRYDSPRKALVLIDLQEDIMGAAATPPFPYKNAQGLITSANTLVSRAEERGDLVVIADQEFAGLAGTLWSRVFVGGRLLPGRPGTQPDRRLVAPSATLFHKPKGDAFSNPAFERFLIEHRVNELYLAGVDAEFCVLLTARGAVNRGYRVHVVKDAVGLMKEDRWGDVLADYTKAGVHIMSVAEF
jgi:nicotinamidase-related amidase